MATNSGLEPKVGFLAELGPGDSLGVGLAALISGADRYFAFDVVEHANVERNLNVFQDLVGLFETRANIPGPDEFPEIKPPLDGYGFPYDILPDSRLECWLANPRLERIRKSIINTNHADSLIVYKVPWSDPCPGERESLDMIYSQAVLEHVDNLEQTYRAMYKWLKPTGYMSHTIDFRSHGIADQWNGHWTWSEPVWKLIRGRRRYLLNREPHSAHIRILREQGFRIVRDQVTKSASIIARKDLAAKYSSMSDDDLITSGAFIQAVRQN